MSYAGPAIAVGSPVATRFNFNVTRGAVNVQIRFFSDAAGLVTIAGGTGSATLTATHSATMFRGSRLDPERIDAGADVDSTFNSTPIAGAVDGEWQEFALGGGTSVVVITPSVIAAPGGAVTYSIVVDAEVRPEVSP